MAHESVLEVLRQLPIPHRNFLFEKFARVMPETRLVEPKLERLADRLSSHGIRPYQNLYLHKGGLLSWWTFPDEPDTTTRTVERRLKRDYPGIEGGLRPELVWDAPPVLYEMKRRDDVLVLKLAALDGQRGYIQNWRFKTIHYDVSYIIVLRDDPFTIEVRAAYGKVGELYQTVSAEIGLRLDQGEECNIKSKAMRDKLKNKLDARCFFAQSRHDDVELAKSTLEAQPEKDLEAGRRLRAVEGEPGVTGFSRWYEFQFEHPDGYVENCTYKVKLSNGQVRVGENTSEPAIKVLEENVVELF
jgi:hypothetical protein